ncbi:hypothetical protein K0817_016190 [Microbacterium sp. HD4P20]|uniref:hypothetical protein n=1 Tax=Microbacterium sp. HD4P20 TaxID=2864874 RepID=UPI001C644DD9|nr:hypothetical protein [Microbacterium sp. HD4P20]MCP2638093.1 hypothetical protein [Microbacterium sp. HD4P20]
MTVPLSTSLERTYRYLRIGLAGTVVVIFVAVGLAAAGPTLPEAPLDAPAASGGAAGGVGWLSSVSDYFYTPARNAFVGALIAAALALFALSGRGAERGLLDAAALFAPLIAVVPTPVAAGSVPGVVASCTQRCFPAEYEPDAANGVGTYLVVGTITVLVAVLLAALRQVSLAAIRFSLVVAVVVLVSVGLTWAFARSTFLEYGHFVATVAFFALFAAVAVRSAFPRRTVPPERVYRVLYTAIAVGLALVLVAYILLLALADPHGIPVVLIIETAALVLFFAFWVVQGVEKWNDPDPTLR